MIKNQFTNWIHMLLFGSILFAVYACEEPIDLDITIQEPKIVVNSNFQPGEPFQITLTKSKSVLSSDDEEFINNAIIKILNAQNQELEQLTLKNERIPFYQSKKIRPESGQLYKVEIDVPEHEVITAEDIVPYPISLKSIQMDTIEVLGETENLIYKVEIKVLFDDPIGSHDYYHLSLFNVSTIKSGFNDMEDKEEILLTPLSPIESAIENPAITFHYEDGGVLFSDEDFDGQTVQLTFYSLLNLNSENVVENILGELKTVSKNYYLYHNSLSRQIANKDRPFVEPITVFNNIENGIGTFSSYAVNRDSASITTK